MAYRYRSRNPETGEMELYEDAGRSMPVNFGGFNFLGGGIPASDPTYSSGFDYARSIAGGMPMSQIMSPGVSYSPEQPNGYTQEQLNAAVAPTPVEPPQKLPAPGETGYGQGIGGVTIFDDVMDKKRMPPAFKTPGLDFGNIDIDAIRQQIADSGIDFTNLFGMPQGTGIDKRSDFMSIGRIPNDIGLEDRGYGPGITVTPDFMDRENFTQPDLSQFTTQQELSSMIPQIPPSIIPQIPSDNNFSIENLNLPDFSNFVPQEQIPMIPQEPLPLINPKTYTNDFLSIQKPVTNSRLSINQLNPRGLF